MMLVGIAESIADTETRAARRALYMSMAPLWRDTVLGRSLAAQRRRRRRTKRRACAYLASHIGGHPDDPYMIEWLDLDACRRGQAVMAGITNEQIDEWYAAQRRREAA